MHIHDLAGAVGSLSSLPGDGSAVLLAVPPCVAHFVRPLPCCNRLSLPDRDDCHAWYHALAFIDGGLSGGISQASFLLVSSFYALPRRWRRPQHYGACFRRCLHLLRASAAQERAVSAARAPAAMQQWPPRTAAAGCLSLRLGSPRALLVFSQRVCCIRAAGMTCESRLGVRNAGVVTPSVATVAACAHIRHRTHTVPCQLRYSTG